MNTTRRLAMVAMVLGLINAGFSAYWALGGRWMLRTVGEWAVRLADNDPHRPAWCSAERLWPRPRRRSSRRLSRTGATPWPRAWRAISWTGAVGLGLYGGINVVVSGAVPAGLGAVEARYDRAAMIGHVTLWDPLFTLRGLALLSSLWLSRRRR